MPISSSSSHDAQLAAATANLVVAARVYRSTADKALSDLGLSQATAWPIVMTGRMGDGVRQGALAEALAIEGPSLVRVLDQLVASGLMTREEDPTDRRAKRLHLTPAGQAIRSQAEDLLLTLRRRLFDGISESDVQVFLNVLDALKVSLNDKSNLGVPGDGQP